MGLRFERAASDGDVILVWTCDMHMWANDMTTDMQAHVLTHMRGLRTRTHALALCEISPGAHVCRAALCCASSVLVRCFLHFRQGGSRAPADAGEEGLPGPGLSGKLDMLDNILQCKPIHVDAPTMAVDVSHSRALPDVPSVTPLMKAQQTYRP